MVKTTPDEPALLAALEDSLSELLPPSWQYSLDPGPDESGIDAALVLVDPLGRSFRLNVEVKAPIAPADFVRQLGWYAERGPWLIVSPRIGPRSRKLFDEAGVSWLEPGGACRIVVGGVVIDRSTRASGRRNERLRTASFTADAVIVTPDKRRYVANLFDGKALRVVRWLLIEPNRRWRLQEMADAAGASIGFVSRAFATLEREAYVERDAEGTRVTDRDALIDAWATTEPPADIVGERVSLLTSPEAIVEDVTSVTQSPRYAATAEAAADQLAPFARFSRVDLYVADMATWDQQLGLTSVPRGGNVALIVPVDVGVFDGAAAVRGLNLVSRPQLYVDLMRRGGAAAEAARFLRERGELWPN